jgi:hypothetical protein
MVLDLVRGWANFTENVKNTFEDFSKLNNQPPPPRPLLICLKYCQQIRSKDLSLYQKIILAASIRDDEKEKMDVITDVVDVLTMYNPLIQRHIKKDDAREKILTLNVIARLDGRLEEWYSPR